jgi:hypothetical protein
VQFCPRRILFKALGAFFCPVRGPVALYAPSHRGPTAARAWLVDGGEQASHNLTHREVIPLVDIAPYHIIRSIESKSFYHIEIAVIFWSSFDAKRFGFKALHRPVWFSTPQ